MKFICLDDSSKEQDNGTNVKNDKYILIMDSVKIDSTDNISEGVIMLISLYFVFNKVWPEKVSCFMEYAQMKWFDIYDDFHTRSKSQAVTKKIVSFVKKLQTIKSKDVL